MLSMIIDKNTTIKFSIISAKTVFDLKSGFVGLSMTMNWRLSFSSLAFNNSICIINCDLIW